MPKSYTVEDDFNDSRLDKWFKIKIINLSRKLGIYENPNELLSISLGSAETTLLKLTSAYCSFVNGGKLVNPKLIDRIQDSEGNTIFKTEDRYCENCKNTGCSAKSFSHKVNPLITSTFSALRFRRLWSQSLGSA